MIRLDTNLRAQNDVYNESPLAIRLSLQAASFDIGTFLRFTNQTARTLGRQNVLPMLNGLRQKQQS